MSMRRFLSIFVVVSFLLTACNNATIKRAELANIRLTLANGAMQKVVIERVTPTDIVVVDSVVCDADGKALIRIQPQDEPEMLLLQFSERRFIPLLVIKNSSISVTADYQAIGSTFAIEGGTESALLTEYFRRLFRDKERADSLNRCFSQAMETSDFEQQRLLLIQQFETLFYAHRHFADSLIRQQPDALANLLIINQNIGEKRLFEMSEDSALFFLIDDALTQRLPTHAHVLKNHERVGNFRQTLAAEALALSRLEPGNKAPDFTLKDLNGNDFTLSKLQGKIVLIAFWATWDKQFVGQLEMLKMMYEDYRKFGFEIVAVSMDEREQFWKNSVENQKVKWINVSDLKNVHSPLVKMYCLNEQLPNYYLIDQDGTILAQHPTLIQVDDLLFERLSN